MATPRSMRVMMLINAVDKATAIINKLSANAVARLGTIQRSSEQLARRAGDMGRQWGTAAMVMAAPLALAADQAIKFEEAMADVRKVTNLKRGTAEFAAMEKSVQRTSIAIGDMPTKVADMYAQLAQGGVAVGDLERIANVASRVAVAFDIDPSVAGDKFIKMQNALGATIDVTESVADAINYLSNNSAAKASQILDYLGAGGASVAKALNITGHESAALGSVFISMGKSGEESATIIERMTKALRNQNKVSGQIFTRAGGGMAGVMAAIEYGRKLSGQARFQFFREFGEYGIQVEQFANNFDLLNKPKSCERVRQARGVRANASKYMAKPEVGLGCAYAAGRYWGVWGRANLPTAERKAFRACQIEVDKFARILRHFIEKQSKEALVKRKLAGEKPGRAVKLGKAVNLSGYVNHPEQWLRLWSVVNGGYYEREESTTEEPKKGGAEAHCSRAYTCVLE